MWASPGTGTSGSRMITESFEAAYARHGARAGGARLVANL